MALCALALAVALQSHAATIAKEHIKAMNSGSSAAIHNWTSTYGVGLDSIEPTMLRLGKETGPHTYKGIVFDAPYEFIAAVTDGKQRSEHLTCFLDSKGNIRYVILRRDNPYPGMRRRPNKQTSQITP